MLVELRITNFRSFKGEQVFSLVADTGNEHESTHTIATTEKGFRPLLRSAAIYGANSAGKTNILRALLFVKELVMGSANSLPGAPIQFTPYGFEKKSHSDASKFEVTFIERGVRYEYAVSVDAERIHYERLIEYPEGKPRQLFLREYISDGKYFWDLNKNYLKGSKTNWRDNTKPNSLFLSVAVLNNSQQLLPAFEWFQKRLVVIAGNTKMNPVLTMQMLDADPTAKARVLAFLREADPGITDLKIERQTVPPGAVVFASRNVLLERAQSGETRTAKASFFHSGGRSKDQLELTSEDESGGALALFESAGAWLNVLSNGEVLLFDEMDAESTSIFGAFFSTTIPLAETACHERSISVYHSQLIPIEPRYFSQRSNLVCGKAIFRQIQTISVDPVHATQGNGKHTEVVFSGKVRGTPNSGRIRCIARRIIMARTQTSYSRSRPKEEAFAPILIVCEGTKTEPQYLQRLKFVKNLSNVVIRHSGGTDPVSIVEYALTDLSKKGQWSRAYCVFDGDVPTKVPAAMKLLGESKAAKEGRIFPILSVPCIEFWFLLHFVYSAKAYTRIGGKSPCDALTDDLAKHIQPYSKGDKGIYDTLEPNLGRAITHAKRLIKDQAATGAANPLTRMHELVEYLTGLRSGVP